MMNRTNAWNNFGTNIDKATSIKEAMAMASLDWEVRSNCIFDAQGNVINGYRANTRTDNNEVLGIVGTRYNIVQNETAFSFTEALLGEGMQYEVAGVFHRGAAVWVLAKLPEYKVLDDTFDKHLVFINSHDGKGSVKVASLPVRTACSNALNVNLKKAQRSWSAIHASNINLKLEEAKHTLKLSNDYFSAFEAEANRLADKKLSDDALEAIIDKMWIIKPSDSDLKVRRKEEIKANFYDCLNAPDIKQYRGTAYAALNAMTDLIDHAEPTRNTETFNESRWQKIAIGHTTVDKFYTMVAA